MRRVERDVAATEVGKPLSEISGGMGLRTLRDGDPTGFWEEGAGCVRLGGRVIAVIQAGSTTRLDFARNFG